MTDSQKIDEILRIVRGLADTAVEHSAELKFIHSQVDIHSEDATAMSARLRELGKSVEQLTRIAEGHERRLRSDRDSIHDLQRAEERRIASAAPDDR